MSDPCHQKEGQIIDDRSCENHTVKAVHDSAVAGNEMTVILDAVIPLDGGRSHLRIRGSISHLPKVYYRS